MSLDTFGAARLRGIANDIRLSFLENLKQLSRSALSKLLALPIFYFRSLALKPL